MRRAAWPGLAALLAVAAAASGRPRRPSAGLKDRGRAHHGHLHSAGLPQQKTLVVACNGFAGSEPALVGIRPVNRGPPDTGFGRHHNWEDERHMLRRHLRESGDDPTAGALWTRELAFASCEEYHIELTGRELFFVTPSGLTTCAFKVPSPQTPDSTGAWAVALAQHEVGSSRCEARSVELHLHGSQATKSAQVAVLDALTKPSVRMDADESSEMEDLPVEFENDAVVRLEDPIGEDSIVSDIVGSLSLHLGTNRAVKAGQFHMTLEDLRGAVMHDKRDIDFRPGHTYVVVRVPREEDRGRHGNQRMVVYHLPDSVP